MDITLDHLQSHIAEKFTENLLSSKIEYGELTVEIRANYLLEAAYFLLNDKLTCFEELIDLCGVDYLTYGNTEWSTEVSGFSRGVNPTGVERFSFGDEVEIESCEQGRRFAVVYHLLSITNNQRIRLCVFCDDNDFPLIDSVVEVWQSANWFEREAFDLYGIMFQGHPDLRRILTDYGFVGHPFRKDFPLVGHVEMRYDEEQQCVVYEPVSIEPRVLVPRVIRDTDSPIKGDA